MTQWFTSDQAFPAFGPAGLSLTRRCVLLAKGQHVVRGWSVTETQQRSGVGEKIGASSTTVLSRAPQRCSWPRFPWGWITKFNVSMIALHVVVHFRSQPESWLK